MNKVQSVCIAAGLCAIVAVSGCTHHDAPPKTPTENPATPTYRSTVNSYEQNTAPRYTQSGINGGEPASLPSVASPDRYSQNTPLATAVYNTIRVKAPEDSRYLAIYSKGTSVKLTGTIKKSDLPAVLALIKSQPGLKSIDDSQLQVK